MGAGVFRSFFWRSKQFRRHLARRGANQGSAEVKELTAEEARWLKKNALFARAYGADRPLVVPARSEVVKQASIKSTAGASEGQK